MTPGVAAPVATPRWWHPWRWFPAAWRELDDLRNPTPEMSEHGGRTRAATAESGDDLRNLIRSFGSFERWLVVVAVLVLVGQRFPATGNHLARLIGVDSTWGVLADDLQWALGSAALYILLPVVHLRRAGRSLRDGLSLSVAGTGRHLGVYLGLFALMLVPVAVVATTADFERIYPLYPLAGRSWVDLAVWELGYAAQFVGLEIFFRGYLLEGLRSSLGSGAIFVMCVPYVMLHFGKTGVESLAALLAGLVLGTLAMRWRSIWGGVLLHIAVAWTMDLTQLVRTHQLPPSLWLP